LLTVGKFEPVKPESMQSFELGYRSVINKRLLIDAYGYYSKYKDFIARVAVGRGQSQSTDPNVYLRELANPLSTSNYSFVYNVSQPVKSYGWGLGLTYKAYRDYTVSGNIYSDKLTDVPAGVIAFFNTPEIRYNLGIANENVYKNIGFNVILKWQGKINWEGTFGTGEIPAYTTLDAQVSYKLPSIKSMIKLGGSNLTNKYYRSAFGNPQVGGLYYISVGYNVF
jgi:outer membrane receptor protein involved in Fe transport